jgi:selenocysteine lyase/cysteine desulfurase
MPINRRQFLGSSALAAAPAPAASIASFRQHFPRASDEVYLDAAAHMPLPTYAAEGIRRYLDFQMYGPGDGRGDYAAHAVRQARLLFARLINAKPSEIAFVMCTKAGEAAVVNGLGIQQSGGNVVTNDLHYAGAIHDYIGRRRAGMDVRIVRHRNWRIDLGDMEKVVDRKTRLIAITLVSNVNGWVEDARALSQLAHHHGAYLYADIIQAAGAVPVDVKALGIDFAACSHYKWLQGIRGAGYLYVREELQGGAVADLSFPGYVYFNYEPWVDRKAAGEDFPYRAPNSAARYEPGNFNAAAFAAQYEVLERLLAVGVDNIYAYVKPMVDRLRQELPALGYELITPKDAPSCLAVIRTSQQKAILEKLRRARIQVTAAGVNRIRISPALYNNMNDIDRLLAALA